MVSVFRPESGQHHFPGIRFSISVGIFQKQRLSRIAHIHAAVAGSDKGPVLVPGDAANSELVRRLLGESVPRMPFLSTSLPQNEIDIIIHWIEKGLPEIDFE